MSRRRLARIDEIRIILSWHKSGLIGLSTRRRQELRKELRRLLDGTVVVLDSGDDWKKTT